MRPPKTLVEPVSYDAGRRRASCLRYVTVVGREVFSSSAGTRVARASTLARPSRMASSVTTAPCTAAAGDRRARRARSARDVGRRWGAGAGSGRSRGGAPSSNTASTASGPGARATRTRDTVPLARRDRGARCRRASSHARSRPSVHLAAPAPPGGDRRGRCLGSPRCHRLQKRHTRLLSSLSSRSKEGQRVGQVGQVGQFPLGEGSWQRGVSDGKCPTRPTRPTRPAAIRRAAPPSSGCRRASAAPLCRLPR